MTKNKTFVKLCAILGWIIIWQILTVVIHNRIVMVGPADCFMTFIKILTTKMFFKTMLFSVIRVLTGFISGVVFGVFFAVCAHRFWGFKAFIHPFVRLLKATPVVSLTILFIIAFGSSWLSAAVCVTVVLPNIYLNLLEGLNNVDPKLLEMAKVFDMSLKDKIFYIYMPGVKSQIMSSVKVSFGMGFKASVAAEVIAIPLFSLGEKLYMSKIYLDTASLLSWTGIILITAWLLEKAVIKVFGLVFDFKPKCAGSVIKDSTGVSKIVIKDVVKTFSENNKVVVKDAVITHKDPLMLKLPSGAGKTTLIKLILGLGGDFEGSILFYDDKGEMIDSSMISKACVFQENRLLESETALKNVEMVTGDCVKAKEYLKGLLDEDVLNRAVSTLSGGEKRRVAIARAMARNAEIVLVDEPFTGLDRDNLIKTGDYIKNKTGGKLVAIASHIEA
ncbi:MAG: ATP-binding cassette domain-containing protein [Lachnospiraceae bacterium]|nr:ATP-binding cassette domain-containing protein [Lachnospiraceae bacterium]